MKKVLQILLGLLLILVLAWLSFSEVSSKIKNDLLSKTEAKLSDKGIVGINAEIEGEGIALTRTVILRGTVVSEKEKIGIASLVEELEGVASVNNQLIVQKPVKKVVKVLHPVVKKTIDPVVVVENLEGEINKTAVLPIKEVTTIAEPVKVVRDVAKEHKPSSVKVPLVPMVHQEISKVSSSVVSQKTSNVPTPIAIQKVSKVPVPVVPKEVSKVPTPIAVIKAPIAVEAEKPEEINKENKNIKTQGVE
ncbi:MAG: Unknown protein [uncultured Sulfurovum sp.]|uniref:BON domain-containing protein n=1 Tax=uncultured Sulfurovum sp. TaxID=269237 RepID=A0A6S6TPZ0_9BACT|nr:MAG: Unknown protein [uncultured Sulfurovum sp.]